MRPGLPEWTVLAVTTERPVHGFAVAALTAAEGEIGRVWQIPRPIVYRAIGRLEESGLITAEAVEAAGGPPRTLYTATVQGREQVRSWLEAPVPHVRDMRSELLLKLAIHHRQGSDPGPLVERQRAVLGPIVTALEAELAGADAFDRVLVAWRHASALAAVGFLDEL
ncbi:PadR family transcriptional regulator [Pseudonocardia sp. KRD291]|uniref:PadR family transcriptional regulator n=1 Tax=Pseudonocardia sp. KRD291 TaxID=2792007 RepID=UPI001C4A3E9C|nr:PadR family transcriptional regulator [Pseudonocardia sp. KRD291]MBW0105123.1 PadR family transcriptional regulator [Pseudonocardia sp. KRD291]